MFRDTSAQRPRYPEKAFLGPWVLGIWVPFGKQIFYGTIHL